jgi:transposase
MSNEKLALVTLTDQERKTLEQWARNRKTAQSLALRSRIVLACADETVISAVAAELRTSRATVSKWRSRFLECGLAGLNDKPRPGRPREVTDEQVNKIVAVTLNQEPTDGRKYWSTRSLAMHVNTSQSTVSRVWRSFGLKPYVS